MEYQKNRILQRYQQPVRDYIGRSISGSLEQVDFVPETHLRIWYNRQREGYALHHHNAMEIILCIENPYVVTVNGHPYSLNAGDFLSIPPNMLHSIENNSSGIRFIGLFNLELLDQFQDYKALESVFMMPFLCTKKTHPVAYPTIHKTFMQMVECYFSNSMFWELSVYSLLLELLVTLGRDYYTRQPSATGEIPGDKPLENDKKLSGLLNYIDSHYAEELTLDMAAQYAGFSKYHFSRLFKQYTDNTYYDYLCHKRVQTAQKLLSSDLSITDIAFQTGFNSLSTFCRCFKKYTQFSPSEYRSLGTESAFHAAKSHPGNNIL